MADRILIVDDHSETVRLMTMVLQRQGYETLVAYDGETAIELAESKQPDLVLLDIMMPGTDGYQVSRILRERSATTNIPILMFSAKDQVDDRVAGYESGADDYLTKPIHPAELVTRVKSLLSRSKRLGVAASRKGYVVGILAPKGGVGSSSLAINLAVSYHRRTNQTVIAAELRPGYGSWGYEMKTQGNGNLSNLLRFSPNAITSDRIKEALASTTFGVQLLLSSNQIRDTKLCHSYDQFKKIITQLPVLSAVCILDIGAGFIANLEDVLGLCDEILLVIEPFPTTLKMAQQLIVDIENRGMSERKLITPILMNRMDIDHQVTGPEIQKYLGKEIRFSIPHDPKLALQAARDQVPMVLSDPDSDIAHQYSDLARDLAQRVRNRKLAKG
jgi:DNA-binding response OmpR family regulator/CO dehydrogenase nickel-insertion accessory protein CooC1